MIEMRNYRFRYTDRWILENINLTVDRELIVVTGKSGSGKSTLALSIAGFLRDVGVHTGEILYSGRNIDQVDLFELAQSIGIVQQDPEAQICTLSVEDEIAFGLENLCFSPGEIEQRTDWALSIVGGNHLKTKETNSLSGGEKQKVAIASILAMKPEVIIFDEPTSNLDVETTKEIMRVITKIKGKTNISAIVIEHKWKHIYKYADCLYEMKNGSLTRIETPMNVIYSGYPRGVGEPVLELRNVTFSYDSPILRSVNLVVRENEVVGIMGANGSGKTTLLMCLMNFLDYEGDILVNKKSIKGKKTAEIARDVGMVFQNPNHQIFENTVHKEACFAATNFSVDCDITPLLVDAGLQDYQDRNPFRLSYGEKRRLNIVSVLSYGPSVILLDEPFIGQDYENVQKIMDLLRGKTCVIVLHDPWIAKAFCTRVFELRGGNLHEITL
ncbi:MAG: ABC transporter ATP-binding protein [Theionarchaea archaeon]|nr:ABC transporter ATP-binding protein [Theionarchaea archaeon]